MKYLLDTNTCVHHLRHGANSPVASKLAKVAPSDVALCSVVLGELLFGALRSNDVKKALANTRAFILAFTSLPFDNAASEHYAITRADLAAKGTPIGPNDLLIASIALSNRVTLVTHNTSEFSRVIGLALEDWQI